MKRFGGLFFLTLLTWSGVSYGQECLPKTDYTEGVSCSGGVFVARNSSDLGLYQDNFGLEEGQYKSLSITFNIDQTSLEVHSPCSIYIRPQVSLKADDICLDARDDLEFANGSVITAIDTIKGIAQKGRVGLKGRLSFKSRETSFSFGKQFRVQRTSDIRVQGTLSLLSKGTVLESSILVGRDAVFRTGQVSFSTPGEIIIDNGVNINSSGAISLQSTGNDAFSHISLGRNARVNATGVILNSKNRVTVKKGVRIEADRIGITGKGCHILRQATLEAPIKEGTCLGSSANQYPRPVIIEANALAGAAPLMVSFESRAADSDGVVSSFVWDFGDGTTGTGKNISHTYTSIGNYIATLVVTDDTGAKTPARIRIKVGGNLPPLANAGSDVRVAQGKMFSLNGSSSSDPEGEQLSYSWTLSGKPQGSMAILGNPHKVNPFFVPDQQGSYTFSLAVSDGKLSSEDTVTITAYIPSNAAPTLNAIGNKSVNLGTELKFTLKASDSDSDPVNFRIESLPLLKNARFNGGTGEFIFKPSPSQVGEHQVTFSAFDGKSRVTETIRITVVAPTTQPTRLIGRVLDTNAMTGSQQEIPIVGATVSVSTGSTVISTAVTNSRGEFSLDRISAAELHVLKIKASTAQPGPSGARYSDFIEPFKLIAGVDNIISRPFYLPRLDMTSLTSVVSGQATKVKNANLKVELSIPMDAITNDDGTTFTGNITVSEVPKNLAPISLPEHFSPAMLITIQPAGIRFSTPATITFPNSDGLPPGAELNIYSIDPDTGAFAVTGRGRVSSDGSKIETISGGIMGATWHFPSSDPVDIDPDLETGNQDCTKAGCNNPCSSGCPDVGSSVPISEGFLLESHNLVTYRSLGVVRGVGLAYNSGSAYIRPIIAANAKTILLSVPQTLSIKLKIAGEEKPDVFYTNSRSFGGGRRRDVRQKVYFDGDNLDTGLYPYEVHITSHYRRSSVTGMAEGKTMLVNQRESSFGSGWSLESHHKLYVDDDGDVMLLFGNSDKKRFLIQLDGSFISPKGDYSILSKQGSKYIRTLKNGTKYIFKTNGLLEKIEDRNKNITLYCYDEQTNRLKYIEDPVGKRAIFTYNSAGKVESIRDPANRVTRLSYDTSGNLILITNPDGSTRSFTYDNEHRMTGQQRENGKMSNYTYNNLGRIESSITSDGGVSAISASAYNGLEEVAQGRGSASKPLSALLEKDERGSYTDRNGQMTMLKVNDFGAEVKKTDALNQVSTMERDENNNPTRIRDTLGRVRENTYDSRGNLLSTKDVQTGAITSYTYESKFNRVTALQSPNGDRTDFSYDSRGDLLKVTDANSRIISYTYNSSGQLETQTDPLGNVTKLFYDNQSGELISQSDSLGNVSEYSYDLVGNLIRVKDPEGNETRFEYDLMNRLIKQTDAQKGITGFAYNTIGDLLSVRDAKGNITSFEYDQERRLLHRRDSLEREEHFAYDLVGNLIQKINRDSTPISYQYDVLNRLVQKDLGSDIVNYEYDAIGNLIRITDSDSELLYTYNSRNQVLAVSTEDSPNQPRVQLSYTYDLNGNRTGMNTPSGDISYAYDRLNRQTSLTHGSRSFSFNFDINSRLIQENYPNGVTTDYRYDESSRLLSIDHKNGEKLLTSFAYSYNALGNKIKKIPTRPSLPISPQVSYAYDNLNQVISATNPRLNMPMETFTYDKAGNRLKKKRGYVRCPI